VNDRNPAKGDHINCSSTEFLVSKGGFIVEAAYCSFLQYVFMTTGSRRKGFLSPSEPTATYQVAKGVSLPNELSHLLVVGNDFGEIIAFVVID